MNVLLKEIIGVHDKLTKLLHETVSMVEEVENTCKSVGMRPSDSAVWLELWILEQHLDILDFSFYPLRIYVDIFDRLFGILNKYEADFDYNLIYYDIYINQIYANIDSYIERNEETETGYKEIDDFINYVFEYMAYSSKHIKSLWDAAGTEYCKIHPPLQW